MEPGGGGNDGDYDITFQVWRPLPTVNSDGCYGLVGENVFTRISSPNYISGGLISVTPEPTNRITAQPGDVMGFYAVSRMGINDGIQLDTSFTGESVWYHRNTNDDPLRTRGELSVCPFPVGSASDRELMSSTNAAPMLSVGICKQLGLSFSRPPCMYAHHYNGIHTHGSYNSHTFMSLFVVVLITSCS